MPKKRERNVSCNLCTSRCYVGVAVVVSRRKKSSGSASRDSWPSPFLSLLLSPPIGAGSVASDFSFFTFMMMMDRNG